MPRCRTDRAAPPANRSRRGPFRAGRQTLRAAFRHSVARQRRRADPVSKVTSVEARHRRNPATPSKENTNVPPDPIPVRSPRNRRRRDGPRHARVAGRRRPCLRRRRCAVPERVPVVRAGLGRRQVGHRPGGRRSSRRCSRRSRPTRCCWPTPAPPPRCGRRRPLLPWRKMGFADDGLAQLDKALAMLAPAARRAAPARHAGRLEVALHRRQHLPARADHVHNRARARRRSCSTRCCRARCSPHAPLPFQGAVWMRAGRMAGEGHSARTMRGAGFNEVIAAGRAAGRSGAGEAEGDRVSAAAIRGPRRRRPRSCRNGARAARRAQDLPARRARGAGAARRRPRACGRGELLALTGPSGSGKSTLLNLAGLIDTPDAGEIVLRRRAASPASARPRRTLLRRDAIGFVFQSFNLVPVMTVADNVDYPLFLAGVPAAERRERVAADAGRGRPARAREAPARRAVGRPAPARGDRPRAGQAARASSSPTSRPRASIRTPPTRCST